MADLFEEEHYDKLTLFWTIPKLKELYDSAKSQKKTRIVDEKFTFCGQNWEFFLQQNDDDEYVGIFLEFYGPDCASADYTVYLKSPSGQFILKRTGLRKYIPRTDSDIRGSGWGWAKLKSMSVLQNEGFLSGGTLQLKLIVKVLSSGNLMRKIMVSKDLKNGLDSAIGTDVTFVFNGNEGSKIHKVEAHRAILSLRNPLFATILKEATEGEVKIEDMTPKAFKILLRFLYSAEVDDYWGAVAEELLYGAEKFGLVGLKEFLSENIYSALTPRNVWKIRKLASLYKLPRVLKSTMKFVKDHTEDVVEAVDDVTLKDKIL